MRFKAPAPPDSWSGTRDALHFSKQCLQRVIPQYTFVVGDDTPMYGEDCLYLNVYSPLSSANVSSMTSAMTSPLPVMVWVHGGGYTIGSGAQYPGTSLAARGVVLVTLNYRLDVFGYVSTEDDVMPGNYGMLDQIAALKWVQRNIAGFGGDPNTVTVFGESAGASSVSLLVMSPLAKGLFHRAIQESGSSLGSWAVQHPGNRMSPAMVARLVGAAAECPDFVNSTRLMTCLQQLDPGRLLNISLTLSQALGTPIYVPRVETFFGFLPDLPINLLNRGEFSHVDTISGFNGHELGNMPQFAGVSSLEEARQALYLPEFTELDKSRITNLFVSTFFSTNVTTDIDTLLQTLVEAQDAFSFRGPALVELEAVATKAQEKSHFLYEFRYRPSYQKDPKWATAFHGDELSFVFGVEEKSFVDYNGSPPSATDVSVSAQMMDMWSSFAKTGVPSPSWKTYTPATPSYLEISGNSTLKTWPPSSKVASFFKKTVRIMDIGDSPSSGGDIDILG